MEDSMLVGGMNGERDLAEGADRLGDRQMSSVQALSFDVLHRDERDTFNFANLVDLGDRGVRELAGGSRLPRESGACLVVLRPEDLQCDPAVEGFFEPIIQKIPMEELREKIREMVRG
jgi:hypothetical protein